MNIGDLYLKIAGRDGGKVCAIVANAKDAHKVLIDGQTRRKEVNRAHLEPLYKSIDIAENASHDDVVKALEKEGFAVAERKSRAAKEKPVSTRVQNAAPKKAASESTKKKTTKSAAKKKTAKKATKKAAAKKE